MIPDFREAVGWLVGWLVDHRTMAPGGNLGTRNGGKGGSSGPRGPAAHPAAQEISEERQRSIRAHANTLGEPVDPGLLALFANDGPADSAVEVTPAATRRSKRDRRPTERAAASASAVTSPAAPTNFEEAFGAVANEEIARRAGTDRDVTRLSVPEEEVEEDEGIAAILNDPLIGRRRRGGGRNLRRGDPKPAAGLFVIGGHSTGAPAASIDSIDEETAAARRRRFGGSGRLPPQVNANFVVASPAAAPQEGPTVASILEGGNPVDQEEIEEEEEAEELDRFHAEASGGVRPSGAIPKLDLEQLKKGVVAPSTQKSYQSSLSSFFQWTFDNEPSWLTPLGKETVECLRLPASGENQGKRELQKQRTSILEAALDGVLERQAALVNLDLITADRYMEYLLTLEKEVADPDDPSKKRTVPLSKSAYGSHRAALYHLFRMHNGIGYDMTFSKRLKALFQSHKRWLSAHLPAKSASGSGKEAIPVALYMFLCQCFFDMGTREGVFCHLYLVLTWNLGCRANNTGKVRLCDIHCSSRDCFSIAFSHTKNDQGGDQAKHRRQMFANPWHPIICPFFAMALYFSTTYTDMVYEEGLLFPGKGDERHKAFNDAFNKMIYDKRETIFTRFGMDHKDLGSHSIRKGTISYLSNLPGGPQQAAICIRAGWTMGTVKDAYMRYMEAGDAFAGRCLAGLNLLSADFACSAPLFLHQVQEAVDYDSLRLSNAMKIQLAGIHRLPSKILLSHLCFASFLHHRKTVLELPPNHVVRESCMVLRDDRLLSFLDANKKVLLVARPWTHPSIKLAGIPPHAAYLAEMEAQKKETRGLVDVFYNKLVGLLNEREIGTGPMAPERLKRIIGDSLKDIRQALKAMDDRMAGRNAGTALDDAAAIQEETPQGQQERHFPMHFHPGKDGLYRMNHLWRWPRTNARCVWVSWHIGCTLKGEEVAPLSWLSPADFKWLDLVPPMEASNSEHFNEIEAAGRTGPEDQRLLRRGSSKVYSDLKVLMVHFENLVHEQNAWPTDITMESVQEMWRVAIEPWMNGEHRNWFRYSWNSSLRAIRRRKRMPTWVEIEAVKKQRMDGMDMAMVEADHGMDLEEPAGVEADQ